MGRRHSNRWIALFLAVILAFGLAVPASAASGGGAGKRLSLTQTDVTLTPDRIGAVTSEDDKTPEIADDEVVRVSIVLDKPSTIMAGYSIANIAANSSAMQYREKLRQDQAGVQALIQFTVLKNQPLDVVWNLTLAANIISANVEYGQIEAIKKVAGVKDVVLETRYEPAVVDVDTVANPQMATSSSQIGSNIAWADGYTGAGSKIAILDTGIDIDHQSIDGGALAYSLEQQGLDAEALLMDAGNVSDVLGKLNIAGMASAGDLYRNSKVPFAFNYVKGDLDESHGVAGDHGSHVAGIAAANAYVPDGAGGYESALDSVYVQGVAPDAQLIVMNVFGSDGYTHDSDYMAAIEDAVLLGADSINLSLGSSVAGFSHNDTYGNILDSLAENGAVVTMSAGNSGYWAENDYAYGYLYADDVNFMTGGSPATYTNSLSVASVDNVGFTGAYVTVGGEKIFYTESSGYGNPPFTTIAGDHDYVVVDGYGTPEDFASVDVAGKIAVCYRGEISFYEKANAAYEAGAVGVIIINNTTGTISMDLTGYYGNIPAVSITMADGELFWDNGTEDETDDGMAYAIGTITVGSSLGSTLYGSDFYTISSFSSWGIPGSLEMKPEIAAPGGNIYSLQDGGGYQQMSGTSMAAPQVAGMAAVLGQYIRENDLEKTTGLTQRQLVQSLLMSTAEPMIEEDSGSYWSILAQGAGQGNVGAATQAQSYIWMDEKANSGAADGKVKVELGDDPDMEGVYEYSFTLNNISGTENTYTLSTDIFTQDLYYFLLDTWTTPLNATVTYTVDGEAFDPDEVISADVDRDGDTDADDAQAVLDYIVGLVDGADLDLDAADFNKDGQVNSYDAHLILLGLEPRFTVPADGSVKITVKIELDDDYLDYYEKGAYIEGYTFVESVSNEEGVLDVTHSIPILGFYGNWSEPSMYDRYSVYDYFNEEYNEVESEYYPYTGAVSNVLTFIDSTDGGSYYQLGNPYIFEEEPHYDRWAIRSADTLNQYQSSLIRNAATLAVVIQDEDGKILAVASQKNDQYAAYYYDTADAWYNTSNSAAIGMAVSDLGLSEGDAFTVSLVAIPEYYGTHLSDSALKALIKSSDLGEGAFLSTTLRIDDTAPEIEKAEVIDGDLVLTVSDNLNVAFAGIYLPSYGGYWDGDLPNENGQVVLTDEDAHDYDSFLGTLESFFGAYLVVADYAGNTSAYKVDGSQDDAVTGITLNVGDTMETLVGSTIQMSATVLPVTLPNDMKAVIWSSGDTSVATVSDSGLVTAVDAGTATITATSVENPAISASCKLTVNKLEMTATGVLADENGNPKFFTWDFSGGGLQIGGDVDEYPVSATNKDADSFYLINTNGWMYLMDKATGEALSGPSDWSDIWSVAYSAASDTMWSVYGPYLLGPDDPDGDASWYGWDVTNFGLEGYLLSIAVLDESWGFNVSGSFYSGNFIIYALDTDNNVWEFYPVDMGGGYGLLYGVYESDLTAEVVGYDNMPYSNLAVGEDGALYYSIMTGDTNEIYRLVYWYDMAAQDEGYSATRLGDVGYDVWPALLLEVTSNDGAGRNSVDAPKNLQKFEGQAVQISKDELLSSTAPSGRLNSVQVNARDDVTVTTSTVSVPVEVEESSNGEFELTYDPDVLTLVSVTPTKDALTSVDSSTAGSIHVAYASAEEISTTVITAKFSYTATSKVQTTKLTLTVSEDGTENETTAESYPLVSSYEIELPAKSSGGTGGSSGSSGVSYTPVVTETENGTVSFNPGSAAAGSKVTITVTPDEGYVVDDISIIDANGNKVTVIDNGDGTYSFTMPSGGVTVTVTYRKIACDGGKDCPSHGFSDVNTSKWYHEYVDYVVTKGIMVGASGSFRPDDAIKRDEIAQILYNLSGKPSLEGIASAPFSDVPANAWYAGVIDWAYSEGIILGMGDGTCAPETRITRQDFTVMLWRYLGEPEADASVLDGYAGAGSISSYAVQAMAWAVENGIMTGDEGGLRPGDTIKRSEVAKMIACYMQLAAEQSTK